MRDLHAVVLAAGKGTRMNSDLAKVLHRLAGRPLLSHVLDEVAGLGCENTVVIVGHQREEVSALCRGPGVQTAVQAQQLGTGHAVAQARGALVDRAGHTLVLCGDVPLIRGSTLESLLGRTVSAAAGGAVLTAVTQDASGYGRILRDEGGSVVGIVEEKDATEQQRRIREYNTGTYCFRNELLWPALERLDSENAQGEFYLTDVVGILVDDGHLVEGVVCEDEREVQGVNTVADLARAEGDYFAMRAGSDPRREPRS